MQKAIFIQIERVMNAKVTSCDLIQSLWSGYGGLYRLKLNRTDYSTVIVKHISYSNITAHPRGWKTNTGHQRKIRSYQIETTFYKQYSEGVKSFCLIPRLINQFELEGDTILILTDLAQQYLEPKPHVTIDGIYSVLQWLAKFHMAFLKNDANNLWETGSYWHLATRNEEFNKMPVNELKLKAHLVDESLNNAIHKTIIHGDAKWANFCFSADQKKVVGLDFQYVGVGSGIKDVMYFLSSVFNDDQLTQYADKMVDYYFEHFHAASQEIISKSLALEIEHEWRMLYPFAWADFTRFLQGWMPTHHKLTGYALKQTELALTLV